MGQTPSSSRIVVFSSEAVTQEGEQRAFLSGRPGGRRHIKKVGNARQHLELGEDIFPMSHQGIVVKSAIHLSGGDAPVIVKIRSKKESFCSKEDEQDWRLGTEVLLNMPQSGGIVRFIEVLEDARNYYVVMEKVSGMDLFETLEVHGNPPVDMCKEVVRELISAVADLHMRGLIHKDLKLENVMVDCSRSRSSKGKGRSNLTTGEGCEGPVVKLIDFDTMELVEPKKPPALGLLGRARSKRAGTRGAVAATSVVGTNQYIAQEAYAGIYSPASDVFAVGVIAYHLFTGKFPFSSKIFDDRDGDNWVGSPKMNEIRKRLQQAEVSFSHKRFQREPLARDLLQRMLAADPHERPTAAEARMHPWLERPVLSRLSTKETVCPDSPVCHNDCHGVSFITDPSSSVGTAHTFLAEGFVVPPDAPFGALDN